MIWFSQEAVVADRGDSWKAPVTSWGGSPGQTEPASLQNAGGHSFPPQIRAAACCLPRDKAGVVGSICPGHQGRGGLQTKGRQAARLAWVSQPASQPEQGSCCWYLTGGLMENLFPCPTSRDPWKVISSLLPTSFSFGDNLSRVAQADLNL